VHQALRVEVGEPLGDTPEQGAVVSRGHPGVGGGVLQGGPLDQIEHEPQNTEAWVLEEGVAGG
jgi:hypothetical protein